MIASSLRPRRPAPPADLQRVALDLDHIRALGGLGRRRLDSLRIAEAEIRALAEAREAALDPTPTAGDPSP